MNFDHATVAVTFDDTPIVVDSVEHWPVAEPMVFASPEPWTVTLTAKYRSDWLLWDCRQIVALNFEPLGPEVVHAQRLIADALRRGLSRRVLLKRHKRFWAESRKQGKRAKGEAGRCWWRAAVREEVRQIFGEVTK